MYFGRKGTHGNKNGDVHGKDGHLLTIDLRHAICEWTPIQSILVHASYSIFKVKIGIKFAFTVELTVRIEVRPRLDAVKHGHRRRRWQLVCCRTLRCPSSTHRALTANVAVRCVVGCPVPRVLAVASTATMLAAPDTFAPPHCEPAASPSRTSPLRPSRHWEPTPYELLNR